MPELGRTDRAEKMERRKRGSKDHVVRTTVRCCRCCCSRRGAQADRLDSWRWRGRGGRAIDELHHIERRYGVRMIYRRRRDF
ncbi:hypothetical protein CLIM01_12413 [Colletotrichum limetticola]|uniref:Uncharacterized protein n=1 Tax=Colletotrichum limetticola TaxID=1209924 RepID=A0ABQ9PHD4_9PEZI|nr:hypothetical protein CLIM01_12413 [Colletotrichum limetticola]